MTTTTLLVDALTLTMKTLAVDDSRETQKQIALAVDEVRETMMKEDTILAKLEMGGFAERAKTERAKITARRKEELMELTMLLADTLHTKENRERRAFVLNQKANPKLDSGSPMKVLMETQPDGSVELVMPMGAPPDSKGYNRNRAFQKQRKTKAQARLREKFEEKHHAHTGEECGRCFWEK
jgi:hypothetical protein